MTLVKRRWWATPWRVYTVLRDRRSAHPMPATYFVTGLVGSVIGVVLDLLLGWPWWAFTLGALVLTWAGFAATGIRDTRELGDDIVCAIWPKKTLARRRRQYERAFREAPFPLYGLDGIWQGSRTLGHWGGGSRPRATRLGLEHGGDQEGRVAVVETSFREEELPVEIMRRHIVMGLRHRFAPRTPDARPMPLWEEHTFLVDSRPESFRFVREDASWGATARIGETTVLVEAFGVEPDEVRLVRVADVGPYVEGSRLRSGEL
jgi:hypothetical protein